MGQQTINIGASPDDGTGDPLRTAGDKINDNFTELYGLLAAEVVTLLISDPSGDALTTGDGKAYYRVPSTLNGYSLIACAAAVTTVSSSGLPTVMIHNATDAVDMLSTALTIDASEKDSKDATTAAVIKSDGSEIVATGDQLRIDIDGAGTGAKGLIVELQFGYVS